MSYCSDITKNRILEYAKEEFLNKGFEKAQVAEIAKAANVTTGAIYRHFKNKEELFYTLVKEVYEYTLEIVTAVESRTEKAGYKNVLGENDDENIEAMFAEVMDFVNYMYAHFEEFRLIFESGKGSRVENFVEEIVNRYTAKNIKMMSISESKNIELDEEEELEVHILTKGYITSLCECILHNIPYDFAGRYIKNIIAFQYYGWKGLMKFKLK